MMTAPTMGFRSFADYSCRCGNEKRSRKRIAEPFELPSSSATLTARLAAADIGSAREREIPKSRTDIRQTGTGDLPAGVPVDADDGRRSLEGMPKLIYPSKERLPQSIYDVKKDGTGHDGMIYTYGLSWYPYPRAHPFVVDGTGTI